MENFQEGAPEQSLDSAQNTQQVSESTEQPSIFDLGSVEKFTWQGKEWTPKDLANSVLAHSDYTRKTQALSEERKKYEESSKYYGALEKDLDTLRENPHLFNEFTKIYPKQFHGFARFVLGESQQMQTQQQGQTQAQLPPEFRQALDKVNQIEQEIYESKVQSHLAEIDSTIQKMSQKYPETNDPDIQELILARAQALADKGQKITSETWETLFKTVNDKLVAKSQSRIQTTNKKQLEANAKAKDSPSGGAIPGQAPKRYKDIREATQAAIEAMQ